MRHMSWLIRADFAEHAFRSTLAIGLHSKPHLFGFLGCLINPGNRARRRRLGVAPFQRALCCKLRRRDSDKWGVVGASTWPLLERMGGERPHSVSLKWLKSS
jgi:hypothetical protein